MYDCGKIKDTKKSFWNYLTFSHKHAGHHFSANACLLTIHSARLQIFFTGTPYPSFNFRVFSINWDYWLLYGTPLSGKTLPRLNQHKNVKTTAELAFVLTTNRNASWCLEISKKWSILDLTCSIYSTKIIESNPHLVHSCTVHSLEGPWLYL